ncbi:MAG: phage holin family protein [Gemmatimonadaceae bacterium]
MTARPAQVIVEPEVGIPDLMRRLTDDSKRLVSDEMRLAKLEVRESVHLGTRGAIWLAVSFGVAVIAMAAFTVFLAVGIARLVGNFWAGALIAGAIELAAAAMMVRIGLARLSEPSYSLEETRAEARATARWLSHARPT